MTKPRWSPSPDHFVRLGPDGRCCGRQPIVYRGTNPHLFCCRCDRSFTPGGHQQENWAWAAGSIPGTFTRKVPLHD